MNTLRRDAIFVAVPRIVNGASILFLNVWAARFLTPQDYGTFSFCTNSLLLADAALGTAFDMAVLRHLSDRRSHPEELSATERAAVILKIAAGLALCAISAIAGEWIGQRAFGKAGGSAYLSLVAVGTVAVLMQRSVQVYFQLRGRFVQFGMTDLAIAAARTSLVAAVFMADRVSAFTLVMCFAAGPALVALAHGRVLLRGAARVRPFVAMPEVHSLWAYVRTAAITYSLAAVGARLDLYILAFRGTPVDLGLYAAGLTIACIPELLGAYAAPALAPRILPAFRDGSLRGILRHCFFTGIPVWIVLTLMGQAVSRTVLPMVLPPSYTRSLEVVHILLPATFAGMFAFLLTLNLLMLLWPRFVLAVEVCAIPVTALAFYIAAPSGAVAVAWVSTVVRLLKSAIIQAGSWQVAGERAAQKSTVAAAFTSPNGPAD